MLHGKATIRVKAYFINTSRKGVEGCYGDPEDLTRLLSVQREQQRADCKAGKSISSPCHNVNDNDDSNDEEMPSDCEPQFGDESMQLKA